jgi:hypothetical protein
MTGARERGGSRRRGWLQRTLHHSAEPSDAAPETPAPDGVAGAGTAEPPAPDTQASLDQVLRQADEARKAERKPDE